VSLFLFVWFLFPVVGFVVFWGAAAIYGATRPPVDVEIRARLLAWEMDHTQLACDHPPHEWVPNPWPKGGRPICRKCGAERVSA
jgi:hypothetical protein